VSAARWPVIAYALLSWAGAFYHLILFSFLKRDVERSLDVAPAAIAWIDGFTFAAAAIGGLLLGRAADKGARRAVLALTPAVPALGAWLAAHADGTALLATGRVLVGLGVGGGWGVGHAVIAETYDGAKRLRASAILQTGGPLAVVVAAFAGCILVPPGPDGWRDVFAWSAVTAAIGLLDPWAARGRIAPGAARDPAAPGGAAAGPGPFGRPAALIFALLALQMTAYWCTFGWLPSHLSLQGASRAAIGQIQMATGATQGVADLLFGWLSPRVGLRRLFSACNAAFGAGVLALALSFRAIAQSPVALAATVCAVGLGSGSWAAFGPLYARHVPAGVRSSVASTSYHLARAVQLLVQPLVVGMAAGGSHAGALAAAAVASWGGAALIALLPRASAPPARATP
jgi:MFS family permease